VHLGPAIRSMFGPYERGVAEAYKRVFVDLDDFAGRLRLWVPRPARILEVGCGEGAMVERLARIYPSAVITGIDIKPTVGRLYQGDTTRVTFLQRTADDVARHEPASFDLVVLCDVLHHVPPLERPSLLSAISHAMAPGGSLAVKDWIISSTPIHGLCWLADRYITGDDVEFFTTESIKALLIGAFSFDAIRDEALVRPWSNNIAYHIRQ
jgi:2-polyprenyl-3-methyl-5-hydroxy-6-metoxy-1,4-benzoquinol methylase